MKNHQSDEEDDFSSRLFPMSRVVDPNSMMFDIDIKTYVIPLTCSKKSLAVGEKIAEKHNKKVDRKRKQPQQPHFHAESDYGIQPDNDSDSDTPMISSEDIELASSLFEQGIGDLAEQAERSKQTSEPSPSIPSGETAEIDTELDTHALSAMGVSELLQSQDIDHGQDSQDERDLDNIGGHEEQLLDSSRHHDRLVNSAATRSIKRAIKNDGLELEGKFVSEFATQLEEQGMSPEEALLEGALNSADVMGNFDTHATDERLLSADQYYVTMLLCLY